MDSQLSLRARRIEEESPLQTRSEIRPTSPEDSFLEYTDRDSGKGTTLDELHNKSLDKDSTSTCKYDL